MVKCECRCGNDAMVAHVDLIGTDATVALCKNCEVAFVSLSLSKAQFFGLLRSGHTTDEHMLHSDFYDEENGKALQPRG